MNYQTESEHLEEDPPVLKKWSQLYMIVFFNLILLILLFYIFTEAFN